MRGGVGCYLFDESGAFFENFLRYNKRSTIISPDIQTTARLLLSRGPAKHAIIQPLVMVVMTN